MTKFEQTHGIVALQLCGISFVDQNFGLCLVNLVVYGKLVTDLLNKLPNELLYQ